MALLLSKIIPSLLVAAGGALGAVIRFWVRQYLPVITGSHFPFSTLLVNLVGCFLAGFVFVWLEHSGTHWSSAKSAFFFVGFLGAFTTFSAFALDSLLLFNQGESLKMIVNIIANCFLCLLAVFVGATVGAKMAAS